MNQEYDSYNITYARWQEMLCCYGCLALAGLLFWGAFRGEEPKHYQLLVPCFVAVVGAGFFLKRFLNPFIIFRSSEQGVEFRDSGGVIPWNKVVRVYSDYMNVTFVDGVLMNFPVDNQEAIFFEFSSNVKLNFQQVYRGDARIVGQNLYAFCPPPHHEVPVMLDEFRKIVRVDEEA